MSAMPHTLVPAMISTEDAVALLLMGCFGPACGLNPHLLHPVLT